MMIHLYRLLLFAFILMAMPGTSEAQSGQLTELTEVKIFIGPFLHDEEKLRLDRDSIKNQVFVFLRGKLPKLAVKESNPAFMWVRVHLISFTEIQAFYGLVQVKLYRPVIIEKTGKHFGGVLWDSFIVVKRPPDQAFPIVREALDRLLTKFAADWYRDNPNR